MPVESRPDPFARLRTRVLCLVGPTFFITGVFLAAREVELGRKGLHANGMVVELGRTDDPDAEVRTPIVQFQTPDGATIRFQGLATHRPPQVGTPVPVLYHEGSPGDARIDRFLDRWLLPSVFTPIGIVLILWIPYQWPRSRSRVG